MKKLLLLMLLAFIGNAAMCQQNGNLKELCGYMRGTFTSAEQALQDTNYYDITLTMMPIWLFKDEGCWLYVEQALTQQLNNPYRQRLYHVVALTDTTFESHVFEFDDPTDYVQLWRNAETMASLTMDQVKEKSGCTVYLTKIGLGQYVGQTKGEGCSSRLRSAQYATSEVTITSGQIVSWDRGFDANHQQVWGAKGGGYIFKK